MFEFKKIKVGKTYRFINTKGTEECYLRVNNFTCDKALVTYLDFMGEPVRQGTISLDGDFCKALVKVKPSEVFSKEFFIVWQPNSTGRRRRYATEEEAKERVKERLKQDPSLELYILKSHLRATTPIRVDFEKL